MRLRGRRRAAPRYMDHCAPYLGAAASVSRRFGHAYVGTEHVLLALAEDRDARSGRVLAQRGLSARVIDAEIGTIVGLGDARQGDLDGDALASLGIDLAEIRRKVEDVFGPGALDRASARSVDAGPMRANPCRCIAPRLKQAFEVAAAQAAGRPMSSSDVLIGLATVTDCIAARILRAHGITLADLRSALDGEDGGPDAA